MSCSTRVGSTSKATRRTGEKIESTGITPMVVGRLVAVGRHVAAALGDRDVDGQAGAGGERGDVQVVVEDVDIGVRLDVGRGDVGVGAGALGVETQRDGLVAVHLKDEVLQVEDDVGDVFSDALDRGELVQRVVEANLRDARARNRRQQRAAQRVAQGVAEAGLERADGEPLTVAYLLVDGFDGRSLDDQH